MPKVYKAAIALGSNLESSLGSRADTLRKAVTRLGALGRVIAVSGFRETAPVGFLEQPDFLNAAVILETELEPEALMQALLAIERAMGRVRDGVPAKGPRVIDLDLLLYEDRVIDVPGLQVPHPAMADRLFVLEPLAEIAGDWMHPVLGLSAAELECALTAAR